MRRPQGVKIDPEGAAWVLSIKDLLFSLPKSVPLTELLEVESEVLYCISLQIRTHAVWTNSKLPECLIGDTHVAPDYDDDSWTPDPQGRMSILEINRVIGSKGFRYVDKEDQHVRIQMPVNQIRRKVEEVTLAKDHRTNCPIGGEAVNDTDLYQPDHTVVEARESLRATESGLMDVFGQLTEFVVNLKDIASRLEVTTRQDNERIPFSELRTLRRFANSARKILSLMKTGNPRDANSNRSVHAEERARLLRRLKLSESRGRTAMKKLHRIALLFLRCNESAEHLREMQAILQDNEYPVRGAENVN